MTHDGATARTLEERVKRYIDNWNRMVEPTEPAPVLLTALQTRLQALEQLLESRSKERRCARHPEAERLDGCVDCVMADISASRLKAEAAEAQVAALTQELDEWKRVQKQSSEKVLKLGLDMGNLLDERADLTEALAALRSALRVLVEKWREEAKHEHTEEAWTYTECATELAAILGRED